MTDERIERASGGRRRHSLARAARLCVVLSLAACSRGSEEPSNVVLISLDTLRADRMSLYGAERSTTPAITALARGGVTFTRAYSPAPWTLPAHAALLTGRYPSSLSSAADAPLYRLAPMLSSVLQDRGYDTAAVTGGGFVSAAYGADVGFDEFRVAGIDEAVAWLGGRTRAKPFFLFFHTYVAHLPYRDFRFAGDLEGGRFASLRGARPKKLSLVEYALTCGGKGYSDAEKEFVRALYDGGVAAADEMVGRLVEVLRERALLERTIVIVTSDHGEEFWDHTDRAAHHGHTLYNELLRVPLVWAEPGLGGAGTTVDVPVSLVDVVPTVLARLRIAAPGPTDGIDVSPLLEGRAAHGGERLLFAEAVRHGPERHAVLTGEGKLIVNGDPAQQLGSGKKCPLTVRGARELYLPSDLTEREEQAEQRPRVAERLEQQLVAAQRVRAAAAAAAEAAAPAAAPSVDAATRERLEALGYAD